MLPSFVIESMADNKRVFSEKLTRRGVDMMIVENKDDKINKNAEGGYEIVFLKDESGDTVFDLRPEDKISIVIREYAN